MLQAYVKIFAIFALMFLGYFLSYKQWFSNRTADVFSKLVLNIALPFNMFLNMTANFSRDEFLTLFSGMIIPVISMTATFIISLLYRKLAKVTPSRQGTFTAMFTYSNTIFIGLPINLAIFGEKAVPYALLYYIVNTTFFWTLGIYEIAQDNPDIEKARITFHPLVLLKKIFTPALLGFIIGLLWVLTTFDVPQFITSFGGYLADLTTPLSMFVIGIIIYFSGLKNLKMNKDIFGVLLGRFVFSPVIVWLLGFVFPVPPLMLAVFMIQSSMPVQNSIAILARNYNADEEFGASSLGYSVLVYLVYIPILLKIIL
ncbi:AEC family transporter [Enterococcus diestrammenae]|uniref:Transporter n=1 Tax=Enterococcus diestrammenae TaxID=1155073 RepID=A0ABV0F0Y6_9ENTE|nr:AEC family transporter [Enterococcus diestrammenae]KAF1300334.1 transporter [Enterococcus diestrammenae]